MSTKEPREEVVKSVNWLARNIIGVLAVEGAPQPPVEEVEKDVFGILEKYTPKAARALPRESAKSETKE